MAILLSISACIIGNREDTRQAEPTTSHDGSVTIGDFYLASVSPLRHHILFKIRLCYTLGNMFPQAVTEPDFLKRLQKKVDPF
jgi:hypothetical protein